MMEPQFTFAVKTEDICVMCLDDSSGTSLNTVSIRKFSHLLNLDYRKIFQIKAPIISGGDGDEVDIQVSLCKSCSKLKNKFYDLVQQFEWTIHRLGTCVQTFHEIMTSAESNLIRVRNYHEEVAGKKGVNIQNTIPERFRKETMQKCLKYTQNPIPPPKMEDNTGHSYVRPSTSSVSSLVGQILTPEVKLGNGSDFLESGSKFRDDAEDDDDEKDPEELMMEYDSCSSFNAATSQAQDMEDDGDEEEMISATAQFEEAVEGSYMQFQLQEQGQYEYDGNGGNGNDEEYLEGDVNDMESFPEGVECEVQVNEGIEDEAGPSSTRPAFSSKFKCNICGKVVVSLKNFELHQRRHAGEKPFECEICKKTFRDTSNLRSHAIRYHRHLLFAKFKYPEISVQEFSAALECLVLSMREKIPKDQTSPNGDGAVHNPHGCRLCGKQYTQGYVIEDHVVQRHYTILAKTVATLQTQICKLSSEDLFQYMKKMEENGANSETSKCGMCGMDFKSGEEVNVHIKSHIKIKVARNKNDAERSKVSSFVPPGGSAIGMKMKCERCEKYFEDLQGLNRHKQQHKNGSCSGTGKIAANFKCEYCFRSFNSYYNQRAHIVSFHRYEVFSTFLPEGVEPSVIENGIKSLLQNYSRLPIGTFECGWCHKEITQLRKLNSHVLVTHFESIVESLKEMLSNQYTVYQLVQE